SQADLANLGDVVENLCRTAVEFEDEIVVVNPKVAHRRVRKIELERLPMVAVVEGNPNAIFRAGKKQASAHMIFADCVNRRAVRQAAGNQLPGLAAVPGAIYVRLEVIC